MGENGLLKSCVVFYDQSLLKRKIKITNIQLKLFSSRKKSSHKLNFYCLKCKNQNDSWQQNWLEPDIDNNLASAPLQRDWNYVKSCVKTGQQNLLRFEFYAASENVPGNT